LVFQQVSTNSVVKELGYPDYVDPNYWTYFNMKIRNLMIGGSFKTIHFQIFNGRVVRIIPVK